jgi:hypothetical protein
MNRALFDSESWSLAEAAAWVVWRSKDRAAWIFEKYPTAHVFDVFNEAARTTTNHGATPEGAVMPFPQGIAELWGRLKDGELRALGIKAGEATWSVIAPSEWHELDYFACNNPFSNSIGSGGHARFFEVTVSGEEVLRLWSPTPGIVARPQRGRKPKIDPEHIKLIVFGLLDSMVTSRE